MSEKCPTCVWSNVCCLKNRTWSWSVWHVSKECHDSVGVRHLSDTNIFAVMNCLCFLAWEYLLTLIWAPQPIPNSLYVYILSTASYTCVTKNNLLYEPNTKPSLSVAAKISIISINLYIFCYIRVPLYVISSLSVALLFALCALACVSDWVCVCLCVSFR